MAPRLTNALTTAVLSAGVALTGCDSKASSPGGRNAAAPSMPPDQTYTVRGVVRSEPRGSSRFAETQIQHEAIDGFVGADGRVVGMHSMIMEFPLDGSIDARSIKPGDKVELTFSVWWKGDPKWMATRIKPLDEATELTFGRADPSRAASGAAEAPKAEPTTAGGSDAPTAPSGATTTPPDAPTSPPPAPAGSPQG